MLRNDSQFRHALRGALHVEILETRYALSGNVAAEIVDGNLIIIGTDDPEQVTIRQVETDVVVAGLDENTLINGESQVDFSAESIYGDVLVDLGAGDNILIVGGEAHEEEIVPVIAAAEDGDEGHEEEARLTIPGDLIVETTVGDDTIGISFVEVGGKLMIETGNGKDVVDVGRGPGFAQLEDHGEEPALVSLVNEVVPAVDEAEENCSDGGPPPDVIVGGRLILRTGGGDDAAKVGFTQIGERLVIFAGAGADQIVTGRGPIRGVHGPGECEGDENPVVTSAVDDGTGDDGDQHGGRPVDVRVAGNTTINVGPGEDFLMMRNIQIVGDLNASGHSGGVQIGTQNVRVESDTVIASNGRQADFAILDSRFAGSVHLKTGPGHDQVFIDNSRFAAAVDVALGSFNDTVALRDSEFMARVKLDGGSGMDGAAWDDLGNSFYKSPIQKSIEYNDLDVAAIAAYMADEETGFGLFLQGRSAGHGG